jgi:hypothetical protein
MTQGKIILSAAALAITAIGSFAFRSTKTSNHKLYTTTNIKRGNTGFCETIRCFTLSSGSTQHACKVGSTNYYTNVGSPSNLNAGCTNKWTHATTATL